MSVPMMQVWIVRMFVPHRLVAVPMGVWLCDFAFMGVIVMGIMNMAVFMLQFSMDMIMFVAFGQM